LSSFTASPEEKHPSLVRARFQLSLIIPPAPYATTPTDTDTAEIIIEKVKENCISHNLSGRDL
jgi:hypothetical protein